MGFIKYAHGGKAHRIQLKLPNDDIIDPTSGHHFERLCAIASSQCGGKVERVTYRDYDDLSFVITSDIELQAAMRYAERFDPGGELHIFLTVSNVPAPQYNNEPEVKVRFDVHDDITCSNCEMEPIVGVRHWCVSRPAIVLCTSCRERASEELAGLAWRKIEYPWLAEDATHCVPRARLEHSDFSDEVKFLQKCLLELGFMKPFHLDTLVGYYQNETAKAVSRFRKAYGVPLQDDDDDDQVYSENTEKMLRDVLSL